jgi:hypothetical protein
LQAMLLPTKCLVGNTHASLVLPDIS